jgi:hypothetical protein
MGERMAAKKRKIAAALAAVSAYLQQEEAAAAEQMPTVSGPPAFDISHWGQSGRQEMMAMRKLIQLRVFTRF